MIGSELTRSGHIVRKVKHLTEILQVINVSFFYSRLNSCLVSGLRYYANTFFVGGNRSTQRKTLLVGRGCKKYTHVRGHKPRDNR